MRIDILMKKLSFVKTRSIAKKACDLKLVKINNKISKASSIINSGDLLEFELYGSKITVKITDVPKGNVAKSSATNYYEMISKEKLV